MRFTAPIYTSLGEGRCTSLHQFPAFGLLFSNCFLKIKHRWRLPKCILSVEFICFGCVQYGIWYPLSMCCLKSWILLYERKVQHSGIVNLTVFTVRCETTRNLRPFVRPEVRRTLVHASFWTTLTSASSPERRENYLSGWRISHPELKL